jgi:hypothetical protein
MGATTRDAVGLYYWDHVEKHVHRYGLLGGLSQDAELTIRLTRRQRLYADAKRFLRAGPFTVILRPRRRLTGGTYRLTVSVRAPHGSSTTRKDFRVP